MASEQDVQWIVGIKQRDGSVATISGDKTYPCEEFARAAAAARLREKPFMSFVAVRKHGARKARP